MKTKKLTLIALFTAVTIAFAQITIPLPFTPVPIALSIVAILTCGAVLDKKSAFLAQLIYVLLGTFGLPIFSNFSGGLGKIVGPTGGYIIAYPFAAYTIAFILEKVKKRSMGYLILAMSLGVLVCYIMGTAWLAFSTKMTIQAAIMAGVVPFVLFDAIKIMVSGALALALNKVTLRLISE